MLSQVRVSQSTYLRWGRRLLSVAIGLLPAAALSQPSRLVPALTLRGHEASVTAVAFAPDYRSLASASMDRTVRIWDIATGTAKTSLRGHLGSVLAIAFSPDGRWLASASDDATVRIWDLSSGRARYVLREHKAPVYALAFSPDGRQLATGSSDQSILVWDTGTGRVAWKPTNQFGEVYAVAFDPGGRWLASGSSDGHVRVWDRQTLLLIHKLREEGSDAVWDLRFTGDGARLVGAVSASRHHVWQTDRFSEVPVPCPTSDVPRSRGVARVAFGGNGTHILMTIPGSERDVQESVGVWNMLSAVAGSGAGVGAGCGEGLFLVGHRGAVLGIAVSADGGWAASGASDSLVRVWIPTWSNPIGLERAQAALQRFQPRDEFETTAEYRARLVAGRRAYMDELAAARAVLARRIAESRREVEVPAFQARSGLELGRYDADLGRFRIRIEGRDSVLYMSPSDARVLAQKRNETIIEAIEQLAPDGVNLVLVNRVLVHPTTGRRYQLGTRVEIRPAQPAEVPPERPPVER